MFYAFKRNLSLLYNFGNNLREVDYGKKMVKLILWRLSEYRRIESAFYRTLSTTAETILKTKPYKLYKLSKGPQTEVKITKDDALFYYKQMNTMRQLENTCGKLYMQKDIKGFCHLYSGQEACAVGIKAAMRTDDAVITSYRAHAWGYLMGISLHNLLAEVTGRKTGCCRGKGGSMHLFTKNFYGGHGIVGAQVPLGTGVVLGMMCKGQSNVCFILYGDGAANQGQAFEAFNMAMLWKLPSIFVCENNTYGMGTSAERSSADTDYYMRAHYIPGVWVDGMDVVSVREAARFAIEHALSGAGPIVLELLTYRYSGHSMSDPGESYRSSEEVKDVRATRDPIVLFREVIVSANLATPEELKKIADGPKAELIAAKKSAAKDQAPGKEEVVSDIYHKPLEKFVRGVKPWDKWEHINIGKTLKR